jgi:hypothetical protein
MSKPAVFGLVRNETQARSAINTLEKAGFIATDISVLSSSAYYNADGVEQKGFGKTREVGHTNATKAPEGATTGAAAGGVIGGVAGWPRRISDRPPPRQTLQAPRRVQVA